MNAQLAVEERDTRHAGSNARARLLTGLPVTERRMQLAGISTAVLEGGDGPPVVLLHEQGEFAARWMRVIPGLVQTHRVIAPDLPGHGASLKTGGALDSARTLAWLDELIARTCEAPPVLVGHMLGGAIAARFASTCGGRIARLVLVDSFGLGPFRPALPFVFSLIKYMVRPTERTMDGLFRHCFFDLDRVRQEVGARWAPYLEYVLEGARTPSAKAALRDLMGKIGVPAIPAADLALITVPTALIWGRHDPVVRLRVAEAASERYGWPLHVIENAADDPPVEQPEAFLRALRAAQGELRDRGSRA